MLNSFFYKYSLFDISCLWLYSSINLEIDEDAEREWPRGKNWLQFGESQEAVLNYFYKDVVVDKSLCLVYASIIS